MLNLLMAKLESLINEHGSAAILREHLALVRSACADLERQNKDLKAENTAIQARLEQNTAYTRVLEQQLAQLKGDAPAGECCGQCGSPQIRRTGTRPHPIMGDIGLREAVYTCGACHTQTFIELPLNN